MADRQAVLAASAAITAACIGASVYSWWRKNHKYHQVGIVTHLNIYPIKSCLEVPVEEALCSDLGLKHGAMADRQWIVVQSNYKFAGLKELPKMILIQPSFSNDELQLDAPGMEPIKIPVLHGVNNNLKKFNLYSFEMEGLDCGEEIAKWLSTFLEREGLRLIQYISGLKTKPLHFHPGYNIYGKKSDKAVFSDAAPYSLMSECSQTEVKEMLPPENSVPLLNFRPNIIIDGIKPFDEDLWNRVKIGKNYFRSALKIPRCAATTVNRKSGIKEVEPLKTLRQFRSTDDENYKKHFPGSPIYGIYLGIDYWDGPIKVGDVVYATYK